MLALVILFVSLFAALCFWCLSIVLTTMSVAGRERVAEEYERPIKELMTSLEERVKRADFLQDAERLLYTSTAYDRAGIKSFLDKLNADRMSQKSGVTDTISINQAKSPPAPMTQASGETESKADDQAVVSA